jgi:hypothetical protein
MFDSLCRVGGLFVSAVLASSALAGCFVQPWNGQITNGQPFSVTGYTDIPSASVVIEMYDYPGVWLQVGSAVSSPTPIYSARHWSQNSPALYFFNTTVNPTNEWYDGKFGYLRVRNVTSGTTLYGGNVDSLGCFLNTIAPAEDFYGVSWNCGFNLNQVTIDNGNIQ